jgi:hypothetical protein
MRHYCTYFDINFLVRGLALYESLRHHAQPFTLWVLCLDEATYIALTRLNYANLRPVRLADLETADPALAATRTTRSRVEYYFTCTPAWIMYLLQHHSAQIALLTYLDADLFFFANPQPLFDELGEEAALIIGHRFPKRLHYLEINGHYNVGWLSFRNDERGHAILCWWRGRCLEWCYDEADGVRFADQKYLDEWPTRFPGVVESNIKGANLAPWNVEQYHLTIRNRLLVIDDDRLIFYHFHTLNQVATSIYNPGLDRYKVIMTPSLREWIYKPYLQELNRLSRQAASGRIGNSRFMHNTNLFNHVRSGRLIVLLGPLTLELYLKPILDLLGHITRPLRHTMSTLYIRVRE